MAAEQTKKLTAVREACKLRPDLRSDEHINQIMDCVQNVKFFGKLTNLQQRALCRTMTIENFGAKEYIFQKGDFGDKFYIILVGSVCVHIEGSNGQPLEKRNLEKGMGFGEIALQCHQPRSATIMTNEKTETLVTKRADYEQYAGQLHRQFIQQRVKFLRQFPRIEDALQRCIVSTQDIAAMANCLNEVSLSGGEMVVRQGDVVDSMIFVRKGQLAMLRLVDLDFPREADGRPCAAPEKGTRRRGRAPTETQEELEARAEGDGRPPVAELTAKFTKLFSEQKQRTREQREAAKARDDSDEEPSTVQPLGKERLAALRMAALSSVTSATAQPSADDKRRGSRVKEKRPEVTSRGKELWGKVRTAVRQAVLLSKLSGKVEPGEEAQDSGMRHVQNFADVSAARLKFAEFRSKELQQNRGRPAAKRAAKAALEGKELGELDDPFGSLQTASSQMTMSRGPRRRLLRIGTVGPVQYFGDRQVCNGEVYPVSLVSDPVADIYMMSKTDIQRRLPKKLFSALFTPDKETVPNDLQILDMFRQAERWQTFRRNMHGEAMAARQAQAMRVPRSLREPRTRRGVDPVANLEFLGINPDSVPEILPAPMRRPATLTPRDEELFSQSSAEFLRKFGRLRRDREVRGVLAKQGMPDRHWDEHGDALPDPMAFRFEQHWSKLGKFSMGLEGPNDDDDGGTDEPRSRRKSTVGGLGRLDKMRSAVNQVVAAKAFGQEPDPTSAGSGGGRGLAGVFAAAAQGGGTELPPLPTSRSAQGAASSGSPTVSGSPDSARDRRRTVNFQG